MTPFAHLPTSEQLYAYCPEVFELCMEVAEVTIAGNTDLDLECFDACETLLMGGTLEAALAHISLEHPHAEEAMALVRRAYVRHHGHASQN